eukprot:SAG31_NODE_1858_length_7061_cov_60.221201_6_plen_32_part_00
MMAQEMAEQKKARLDQLETEKAIRFEIGNTK